HPGATMPLSLLSSRAPSRLWHSLASLPVCTFLVGPRSGLYIGAGMCPGPRDGLMTAIARRGPSVRRVRTLIELSALAAGFALGGTVGLGTVLFAVTIGPNVQFFLERFDSTR